MDRWGGGITFVYFCAILLETNFCSLHHHHSALSNGVSAEEFRWNWGAATSQPVDLLLNEHPWVFTSKVGGFNEQQWRVSRLKRWFAFRKSSIDGVLWENHQWMGDSIAMFDCARVLKQKTFIGDGPRVNSDDHQLLWSYFGCHGLDP